MPRQSTQVTSLPVAVERTFDLWMWLEGRVADFSVYTRQSLGRRILDSVLDLMADLLRATYALRRSEKQLRALTDANERVTLLRLLVRGARERRYMSMCGSW
ncbi:MAG: four helix bundle protein [Polyangiaceae bacterium]|nr:four helix bundle protein [Polyangiaceae bacterium]